MEMFSTCTNKVMGRESSSDVKSQKALHVGKSSDVTSSSKDAGNSHSKSTDLNSSGYTHTDDEGLKNDAPNAVGNGAKESTALTVGAKNGTNIL